MIDARAGKIPTTLVRRRISVLTRSWGLLDQTCRQFALGNPAKAKYLGAGLVEVVSCRVATKVSQVVYHTPVLVNRLRRGWLRALLLGRSGEGGCYCVSQAWVVVRADTAAHQTGPFANETAPKRQPGGHLLSGDPPHIGFGHHLPHRPLRPGPSVQEPLGEYEPRRSCAIRNSIDPTRVSQRRVRYPLRRLTRSGLCCPHVEAGSNCAVSG